MGIGGALPGCKPTGGVGVGVGLATRKSETIEKLGEACSYREKLSQLARRNFDRSTSEISPCSENNMKSYIAFMRRKVFTCTERG